MYLTSNVMEYGRSDIFVPCEHELPNFDTAFDEMVIFQENHILPVYIVELY